MTPFLTTTGGGSVRGFGRQGIQRLSSGPPAYVSGASLLLDAGQASSYSSGTAWVDLSGNGYDMTWQSSYGRGGSGTAAYFTQGSAYAQRTSTSFYGVILVLYYIINLYIMRRFLYQYFPRHHRRQS